MNLEGLKASIGRVPELELGLRHFAWKTAWNPDRANPKYRHVPNVEWWGLILAHPDGRAPELVCYSGVTFDTSIARAVVPAKGLWTVESWSPLTLSPSILCRLCGDHGFIRAGKWVPA
jgi:hypothetical protein